MTRGIKIVQKSRRVEECGGDASLSFGYYQTDPPRGRLRANYRFECYLTEFITNRSDYTPTNSRLANQTAMVTFNKKTRVFSSNRGTFLPKSWESDPSP
eukprot:2345639-Pyramimonas_sp.AAC.2